jgi:hypothetical protein
MSIGVPATYEDITTALESRSATFQHIVMPE